MLLDSPKNTVLSAPSIALPGEEVEAGAIWNIEAIVPPAALSLVESPRSSLSGLLCSLDCNCRAGEGLLWGF